MENTKEFRNRLARLLEECQFVPSVWKPNTWVFRSVIVAELKTQLNNQISELYLSHEPDYHSSCIQRQYWHDMTVEQLRATLHAHLAELLLREAARVGVALRIISNDTSSLNEVIEIGQNVQHDYLVQRLKTRGQQRVDARESESNDNFNSQSETHHDNEQL